MMERLPKFFSEAIGDVSRTITGVNAPESGLPNEAVFLSTPKALVKGLESQAGVIVVHAKAREKAEAKRGDRTILISPNPELAMANVLQEFFLESPYLNSEIEGIHPKATVSPKAKLGPGVRVGPGAFIAADVTIGAGAFIGTNSIIEAETTIGEGTVIHPNVYVGHSTQIGARCEIHPQTVIAKEGFGYAHDEKGNHYKIPHVGRVVLEDNVHIGACCTIDRGTFGETRIEFGAKFDNLVHIAHNVRIGRNALITAGFVIGGSSRIGANFVTGGRSVVTGHIEICDNVHIAGLSGVGKSITKPGQYGGFPLQPLQQFIKTKAATVHLAQMRKQLNKIMKHLGIEAPLETASDEEA
jgi:UDP-3-O-[3-hydroxymyristoyl] glucosamine N-acyltransferase